MFRSGNCVLIAALFSVLILHCLTELESNFDSGEKQNGTSEPQKLVGPAVRNESVSRGPSRTGAAASDFFKIFTLIGQIGRLREGVEDCLHNSRTMMAVLATLQRLEERLSAMQALGQEQTRKLEGVDYRLTKLEVQEQERSESLRTMVADMSRNTQQLSWQNGQIVSSLEGLRQGQDENRHALAVLSTSQPTVSETKVSMKGGAEILQKIQTLANAVQGTKAAISTLTQQTTFALKNISTLANLTRSLKSGQSNLLTRQAFSSSITELRSPISPNYFMMQQGKTVADSPVPSDCSAIKKSSANAKSGIYRIQPSVSAKPFYVFCEMSDRGGGWTVIQNRYEGAVNFYRDWLDYKHGFGNIGGEFWLGLERMHLLTNDKVNELVIELEDFSSEKVYAQYSAFAIGSEVEGYSLSFLAGYEGDAGDSLSYHAGMKFSTRDFDNDQWSDGSCAENHSGAWWYSGCDTSNLNGLYLNGELPEIHEYKGIYWYDWHGPTYSLMSTRMMIRPIDQPVQGLGIKKNATSTKKQQAASKAGIK